MVTVMRSQRSSHPLVKFHCIHTLVTSTSTQQVNAMLMHVCVYTCIKRNMVWDKSNHCTKNSHASFIIIINTLQYSKRIEGQPTTRVGSPKKLKLNLLNYKTKVPRNCYVITITTSATKMIRTRIVS